MRFPLPHQVRRFWSKVERSGDCWLYNGTIRSDGYGYFQWVIGGERFSDLAHRVAWWIRTGKPVPSGFETRHGCRSKNCVRHLKIGTSKQNKADMLRDGTRCRGITHGMVKLSEQDVKDLFAYKAQGVKQKDIALFFGVKEGPVSYILSGKRWSHLRLNGL